MEDIKSSTKLGVKGEIQGDKTGKRKKKTSNQEIQNKFILEVWAPHKKEKKILFDTHLDGERSQNKRVKKR